MGYEEANYSIRPIGLLRNMKGRGAGTRRSAIGQCFFPVPTNSPRSLCKRQVVPVSSWFLKW